jgi:asparagine synthase (glutamine-hydrolysing)
VCGIAGYFTQADVAPDVLTRMLDAVAHRGPDERGEYTSGAYRAGMCRLSINDLEQGGQPLFNGDRSVVLLYNGEIYNSPALRRELSAKGYAFRTHSDGEVICHLYDEYGEELFERLDGMFAAALWDVRRNKLLLARDLPGEKPLYYARLADGGLVFGSEIKALRTFPDLSLTLDRQAIWDFPTFLWIPEPDTVFEEIKAVPRGHILAFEGGGLRLRRYSNRFNTAPLGQSDGEIVAETRRVVSEAVHSRLLSDVPVGSFLSGGLDSSIVATLATQALGPIDTFSVGFEKLSDPYHGTSDESEDAAAYAARLGSRHHLVRVTAETFHNDLDRFCHHADQPFSVSSGLGVLSIARAAREQGIKVLLSGDCADECFGGYSWYQHLPLGAGGQAGGVEASGPGQLPVSFQNFGMSLEDRLGFLAGYEAHSRAWAWHYYAHESEKSALFAKDWQAGLKPSLRYFRAFDPAAEWTPETYIAQDRDFYMPQEMLRKVDRMTMAYSVEGRVPFAAPAVLSHADKLSYSSLVRGDTLKWALRTAFADVLPAEVTARPKHGFNVPIDHWLKDEWSDLVDEAFAGSSALRHHGLVAGDAGAKARRMIDDPRRLNGHTIFSYIMLNRWLEGLN